MQSSISAMIFGDQEDPRDRLAARFGDEAPVTGQPPAAALTWAREQLAGHPSVTELEAIQILRRADRRMTLKTAAFLAKHAVR